MPTRREFVTGAAASAAACALAPRAFGKKMDRPLGVQLYTVRSLVDKDFPRGAAEDLRLHVGGDEVGIGREGDPVALAGGAGNDSLYLV